MPDLFAQMRGDYEAYVNRVGVLPVPEGYHQQTQVMINGLKKRYGGLLLGILSVLAGAVMLMVWWWRRSRAQHG